jgi:hypothetical protein
MVDQINNQIRTASLHVETIERYNEHPGINHSQCYNTVINSGRTVHQNDIHSPSLGGFSLTPQIITGGSDHLHAAWIFVAQEACDLKPNSLERSSKPKAAENMPHANMRASGNPKKHTANGEVDGRMSH